jgi:hypothetical protein
VTKVSAQLRRQLRLVTAMSCFLFALVALGSWAFSSAVGSSPDDNFHLASLWCGTGDRDGICESTTGTTAKLVPKLVYESANCYAYRAEQSAQCQNLDLSSAHFEMSLAEHANSINLYPPVFYGVNSLFVTTDPVSSVLFIRLFNAFLAVVLFACLFALLPRHMQYLPIWAIAATSVPLGMFIIPSTNPSSWAIISAGILLYSLLGFFQTSGIRKALLAGLSIVAVLIGAGARADSGLYSTLIAAVAVFITFQSSRKYLVTLMLPLAISLIGAYFYLSTNQASLAAAGLEGAADPTLTTLELIVINTVRMPLLWLGIFGSWGLGWLDTILPPTVWISSLLSFVILIVFGLNRLKQRTTIAAVVVAVAMWLIPLYVLVKSHAVVGTLVQPRYVLPLIIVFSGLLAYRGLKKLSPRYSFLPWVAILLLSIANAFALHRNIRRYTTGVDASGWNLDASIEWWWNIPLSPMGMWAMGAISFVLFLVALKLMTPKFTFGVGATQEPLISAGILTRKQFSNQ